MGKKHIIKQSEEEVLKEAEKVTPEKKASSETPNFDGANMDSGSRKIVNGRAYIHASYNNTIITMTDAKGNVVAWASAGSTGFKGAKKATPFAASRVAEVLMEKVSKAGIRNVDVLVRGIGSGRDSAVRSLSSHGLNVMSIEDITPVPHNGCRPKKPRRV